MKVAVYLGVWIAAMVATALELMIVGMALAPTIAIASILGLGGLKAVLIALFYQHVIIEPRAISTLYITSLIAATALIIAMLIS